MAMGFLWFSVQTARNDDLRVNHHFLKKFDEVIEAALEDAICSPFGTCGLRGIVSWKSSKRNGVIWARRRTCMDVGKLGGLPVVRAYAKCVACDHGHLGQLTEWEKESTRYPLRKREKEAKR